MKYAAIVEFKKDLSKYDETRPAHRAYLTDLVSKGKLFLAGGFTDKSGGMIIYEAETPAEVESMIRPDPFMTAGVFDTWQIRPYNAVFVDPKTLPPTNTDVKYAAIIEYTQDASIIAEHRPKHREYLGQLFANGQLPVSGPFTDDSGALIVYHAGTPEAAEAILRADPFHNAGVFVKWQIRPWWTVFGNPEMYPKP